MEKDLIIYRSTFQAIAISIISYPLIAGLFWFNYKFIDGNNIVDFFIIVLFFGAILTYAKNKMIFRLTPEQYKKIEEIINQN